MSTRWLGVSAQKCPLDLWVYQEILFDVKPDLIIETGTYGGGSTLFLASICDLLGAGQVISIDIEPREDRPSHGRITYLTGSSTAPDIVQTVTEAAENARSVVVILDSDHSEDHVYAEMKIYSRFVNVGSYLIVEDTNVGGNPILPDHGPGPKEAAERFLTEYQNFQLDPEKEKFFMTFNPSGYLRRIR